MTTAAAITTARTLPPAGAALPDTATAPNYHNGIYYPDTDGEPLPDGFEQEPLFYQVTPVLRAYLEQFYDVIVSGDTFLYYEEGNPRRFVAPDCYVAFGVRRDAVRPHNSYFTWHVGRAPDFVLEIASESTVDKDLGDKIAIYASMGVGEYWLYDATPDSRYCGAPLICLLLVGTQYVRMPVTTLPDGRIRGHSPALGLDLYWDDGRLRFYDPMRDAWLLDYDEQQEQRIAAEARAEVAENRAEAERQARQDAETRAEAERQSRQDSEARLAEMESELRRLRGDE